MKKLLTLLFVITIVQFATAQDFPGDMPELIRGRELRVKPSDRFKVYGYRGFATDRNFVKAYKGSGSSTPYNELVNKVFRVTDIQTVGSGDHIFYRLILDNPETGTLYYWYSQGSPSEFVFEVVGGLTYPDGFFCRDMKQQRFTAEGQTVAPPIDGIRVIKTPEAKGYSLALAINVATKDVALGDGAVIKLENGKTISRPKQPVASNTNGSGGMVYTIFFELTKDDVALLRDHKITEVQLYRHNHEIENGYTLREYLKCLDK